MTVFVLLLAYVWAAGSAFPVLFLHFALTRHYEPWVRLAVSFVASCGWPVFLLAWLVGTYEPE